MCGFQGTQKPYTISGDNGERDPPVPIPNTEVKPFSADGTWLETTWESRTLPDSMKKGAVSKWLKQAMRGSAFFRNIFGQAKTECRKNGTQGIIFIRNCKWNEL